MAGHTLKERFARLLKEMSLFFSKIASAFKARFNRFRGRPLPNQEGPKPIAPSMPGLPLPTPAPLEVTKEPDVLKIEPTVEPEPVQAAKEPPQAPIVKEPVKSVIEPSNKEALSLKKETIIVAEQINELINEFQAIEAQYSFGIDMSWMNNIYKRNEEVFLEDDVLPVKRYPFRLKKLNEDLTEITGMLKKIKVLAKRADAGILAPESGPRPTLKK
jgi:hypothetical protein